MTFKSAVDKWYYAVLVFVVVIMAIAINDALPGVDSAGLLPLALGLGVGLGLPVWLLFSTNYTVTEDKLLVRCGPLRIAVDRDQITGITPTRSLLSAPALSLDRLAVQYGNGKRVVVSPADKPGFYRALGFTPHP